MPLVLLFLVLHLYKTGIKYLLVRKFEFSVVKGVGAHLFKKFLFHAFSTVSVSPQKIKKKSEQVNNT